mgnify:CR=1 FL=1
MEHGMAEHMAPPFKKAMKKQMEGEAGAGMKGGKKGGKARMQGLSLAGRKGASRRKP